MKIMKILILSILSFVVLTGASYTDPYFHNLLLDDQNQYEYIINVPTNLEVRDVTSFAEKAGYDVAGVNLSERQVGIITSEKGYAFLNANGLFGHKKNEFSLSSENASLDPRYYNPEKIEAKLKELNQKYPNLTKLEVIGQSLEGRSIWALMVSTTPDPDSSQAQAKPTFLFDGMHHAREIMTPEVVVDAAEYLLENYKSDATATQILDGWNVWMVPMLNVDGNNIVWTSNKMWRKNARSASNQTFGVDINRNYPYKWNSCNGSSGSRSAQDYRGEGPASEPETQALMGLAEKIRPTAGLSFHSYSELVLYPYGCSGEYTGEQEIYKLFANDLASVLPSDSGKGNYKPGTPWEILYSTDGDSDAYLQGMYGAMSFVIEMNQEFQPSYSLRDPTVAKLRKGWLHLFEKMDQSLVDVEVVDAKTKAPLKANIYFSTIEHTHGEPDFVTNDSGHFFKVLLPNYKYTVVADVLNEKNKTRGIQFKTDGSRVHVRIEL